MIHYIRKTRPSALALRAKLSELGYRGRDINWGTKYDGALNAPHAVALASNKRRALYALQEAEVPVPRLYTFLEALEAVEDTPLVGRPDYHRKGRKFFLCYTPQDVERAKLRGATHFMEFIDDAREFRVQVVNGQSIKISEKIGGGATKNFESGARFYYPDFNHKLSLRKYAKAAVEALGLDFGAVDVLWKDDQFYVLEVNTACCLTNERSDTLDRFARALLASYGGQHDA